jgi:hypothetical protein
MLQKSLPHLAAIAVFLLLSVFFFRPQLSGKLIEQGDIMQYLGMAKEANDYKTANGEDPLWTNSMFGGMPTYQINTVSAGNNLKFIEQVGRLFIAEPIGQFFLAMLSFYVLMLTLGVHPIIGIMGSVAFGLTTNNLILYEAGHLTKLKSISFFPLIASGALLAFRGRLLWGGVIFATGLGLNIFSNHVQMTYYLALTFIFLGFAQLIHDIKEGKLLQFLKATSVLLLAAGLALGATASNLMTTLEYSRETMRGKPILEKPAEGGADAGSSSYTEGLAWDYAMQWSNGTLDVLAGFIPGITGGSSSEKVGKGAQFYKDLAPLYQQSGQAPPPTFQIPLYWGELPFTSGPIYFGVIAVFLFVLGLFVIKGPLKWWVGLGVLLTVLLSMGKNLEGFNRFMFDYFPLYNKFRTPNSVLSITSFLIPMLAFAALGRALTLKDVGKKELNALYIATGISGGIALFFAILGPSFFDFSAAGDANFLRGTLKQESLIADRKSLMRGDSFRALLLVLLSAGLLWAYWKKYLQKTILLAGFGVLVLFDVWSVGRRYIDDSSFTDRTDYENRFKPTPADQLILKDKDPNFRVFDRSGEQSNPFASSRASYFHKSIGGYHAAKLQRYQDIIDRHLSKGNMKVFNMLNTKYFILTEPDGQPVVEPNVGAIGNAWFVSNINMAENADSEINALEGFVPEEDAIVHKEFESYVNGFKPDKAGDIKLTSYSPNKLVYSSTAPSEQFAVFSEIWYGPDKGWKAYVDGQPADHIRADYILRAMRVPAGTHKIEFVFEPNSFQTGKLISTISSSVILAAFLGLVGFYGYKAINSPNPEVPQKSPSSPKSGEGVPAKPQSGAASMKRKGKR